jgi:hypothetical protein
LIALATGAARRSNPGLIAMRSAPRSVTSLKAPVASVTRGSSRASRAACGGSARVSATRTSAPCRASQRVIDNPVSPSPSTTTFRPFSSTVHQRNFSVDNPTRISIMVMIQNLTRWLWLRPRCALNLPRKLAFAETNS